MGCHCLIKHNHIPTVPLAQQPCSTAHAATVRAKALIYIIHSCTPLSNTFLGIGTCSVNTFWTNEGIARRISHYFTSFPSETNKQKNVIKEKWTYKLKTSSNSHYLINTQAYKINGWQVCYMRFLVIKLPNIMFLCGQSYLLDIPRGSLKQRQS